MKKTTIRRPTKSSADLTIEQMALRRIRELIQPLDRPSKLIRFPVVFGRICPVLCLSKKEAWRVLHQLREGGHIEMVPFQGVRLLPPHLTTPQSTTGEGSPHTPDPELPRAKQSVLTYLRRVGEAYPSDIAVALDLDLDVVFQAARGLLKDGRIEV